MSVAEESGGTEFDDPPRDPMTLLHRWWDAVHAAEVPGATALSLATVGADGTPSVRFVAMADVRADGVVFSTDDRSPKAQELAHNPHVAVAGYWEATGQQYRIKGVAEALPDADSERLFAALPRSAQAALRVAEQSAALDSHQALVHRAESLTKQTPLRRPRHWRSWLVRAQQVQFWSEHPLDVHRRLAYVHTAAGWSVRRLQP